MKTNFTRLFLCVSLFSILSPVNAQTDLSPGDIAFVGYNSDDNITNGGPSNDDISFILLRNIDANTVIYFTDFGWVSAINAFQSGNSCGAGTGALTDGVVRWTASSNMSYGAQVNIRCHFGPTANVGTAFGFLSTTNSSTEYMSLAVGGDHVFAYQGTKAAPTLIAGIGMNGNWDGSVTDCQFSSSISALPIALNSNNYAFTISPEVDNARLKTTAVLTGVAATDRAFIHNAANWDVNDNTAFQLPVPGLSTLPVHLVSFSGKIENGAAKLTWTIAEEQDLKGYAVERSADGANWKQTGFVPATGSASYSWTDAGALGGRKYYRLNSIDLDGRTKFSPVVTLDPASAAWQLRITPNPVVSSANINIQVIKPGQLSFRLLDAGGKVLWQRSSTLAPGMHAIPIDDVQQLAKGLYFLHVQMKEGGINERVSFIKQ